MLCGFVTPAEGLAGMSNDATVTVLALMILSVGLESTGVINQLGERLRQLFNEKDWWNILLVMVIVGVSSAFIATTAVVIVFLRIMVKLSKRMPTKLSKLLMPLSFAGILGGSCTLLGTSTNLLVSAIAGDSGLEPFGMFEFTHIGAIFFVAGLLYMLFIGRFLIPDRSNSDDLTDQYEMEDYLTEVIVKPDSPIVGKQLREVESFQRDDIDLVEIRSNRNRPHFPNRAVTFQEGDTLLLKGSMESIAEVREKNGLSMLADQSKKNDERLNSDQVVLCEVIVRPGSRLQGTTLNKATLKQDYNAVALAVKKNSKYFHTRLSDIKIEAGDTVLMEVESSTFDRFYNLPEFVVLEEYPELATKSGKRYVAAAIIVFVILLAALKILPILVSALAGCVAMFLTGCLNLQKAYRRVDWSVFFLLAGVIPLGTAMNNTGASDLIAATFVEWFGEVTPRVLVGVLFIFTAILSSIISNNATAILIAPIAISIAASLNLDPRPLLFTGGGGDVCGEYKLYFADWVSNEYVGLWTRGISVYGFCESWWRVDGVDLVVGDVGDSLFLFLG